jgi:hypothetical protein
MTEIGGGSDVGSATQTLALPAPEGCDGQQYCLTGTAFPSFFNLLVDFPSFSVWIFPLWIFPLSLIAGGFY